MDVFILFSRYEGLPNVLIEAQMVGVPVISTPAGGSAECFIEGVSGFILDDAQTVNLDQSLPLCRTVGQFMAQQNRYLPTDAVILQERFTVEHMVGTFVQTIASQPR